MEAGQVLLGEKFPALADRLEFLHPAELTGSGFADVALLIDCFEHLADPPSVLRQCYGWLRPGGVLWIRVCGPGQPRASHCGGHIPIPRRQVLFSEHAIIRTIQRIVREPRYVPNLWEQIEGIGRWDHVRSLKDRPGEPLNMLSLRGCVHPP